VNEMIKRSPSSDFNGNNSKNLLVGIRPEDVVIYNNSSNVEGHVLHLSGIVENISFSGREAQYHVKLIDGSLLNVNVTRPVERFLDEIGKTVILGLPHNSIFFFNSTSGLRY